MKKDMADVCEEAHRLTVEECEKKDIELDINKDEYGDEVIYTEEAQEIFNKYFDKIVENNN